MVVLRKLQASTLMETLVATVLIVVVFMVASMILNNLFLSTMHNQNKEIKTHLNELQYLYKNNQLTLPHYEEVGEWHISITTFQARESTIIEFGAKNLNTEQSYTKEIYEFK